MPESKTNLYDYLIRDGTPDLSSDAVFATPEGRRYSIDNFSIGENRMNVYYGCKVWAQVKILDHLRDTHIPTLTRSELEILANAFTKGSL